MWDKHTIWLRLFLVMSINLVTLNHWVWPHLNADMAGTCLNSRFFFFFFLLPFKFHQSIFPPDSLPPSFPPREHLGQVAPQPAGWDLPLPFTWVGGTKGAP